MKNFKSKNDELRNISLEDILLEASAVREKNDKHKWLTSKGTISINGQKFFNWNNQTGGGGAIDLTMCLFDFNFKTTVIWLESHFPLVCAKALKPSQHENISTFTPPQKDDSNLIKVVRYLKEQRKIPLSLVQELIMAGKIYGDSKANAVFLLLGKRKEIVGAELRGTSDCRWVGMAKGSRKEAGAFYVKSQTPQIAVICESAIDAISFFTMTKDCLAISTAGVNPNPAWLKNLLTGSLEIFCGFDSDEIGDLFAGKMIQRYPQIKRLRPDKHDWNEVLKSIS